jgi:hypothetical protein
METQVRTPQAVFMMPQILEVPLFQRPYVWSRESQWEPLWHDVARVAERLLIEPKTAAPHFLGAVVLQKRPYPIGSLPAWSIIDGQQRLTTLQLLLDALHAELVAVGADAPAQRVDTLVANPAAFGSGPADRFKVRPTTRDRQAFERVMSAEPPITYDTFGHGDERLVQAHRFFAEQARVWLALNGPEDIPKRADAIDRAVRDLLQVVVIDLQADENAQEIFETLNARGTPLTAADLIKNFVFQRLVEQGEDVQAIYERHWKHFETGFWEAEMVFGRLRYSRSSIFLNHWLTARTGEEIVAREVFSRFKRYADDESQTSMVMIIQQIQRASGVYRGFIEGATVPGPVDQLQLFAYRTGVLESEVFKPIVLWLYDPEQPTIGDEQLRKALEVLESWLVRRMLVRATSSSYTQIAAELVTQLRKADRGAAGDVIEQFFGGQNVESRYWPDDADVRQQLTDLPAYRRVQRGRLRMVLEAIEDDLRGWSGASEGLGGERVPRGKFHIEHVMPRRWTTHWPLEPEGASDAERDQLVHTLGNLTLLTARLNSKVSHGPWGTKGPALAQHDVLKLNAELLGMAADAWTEDKIRRRTEMMIRRILGIWRVPEGHTSGRVPRMRPVRRRVALADLIGAGLLEPGTVLHARRKALSHRIAVLLADGQLDVDGEVFATPSGAAKAIVGRGINGWRFFLVDPVSRRRLADVVRDYADQTAADIEDDVDGGDEDDDDDDDLAEADAAG